MLPRPDRLDKDVPREVMLMVLLLELAKELERVDLDAMLWLANDPSVPWKNEVRDLDFWIRMVSMAACART